MAKNVESVFHDVLQDVVDSVMDQLSVGKYATVVRYDAASHIADVQPLGKDSDGSRIGVIHGARVSKSAQRDIKVGSTVVILFMDGDTDNFSGSGAFTKASSRKHDINDATILEVM